MASAIGDPLEGSIDEAALAIEALMRGETAAPSGPTDEEEQIAAQIEAKSAPEAPATEQPTNTGEEAPSGELPVAPAQAESAPQAKVEPAPAPKPIPVATQPATQSTASDQLAQLNQLVPVLQANLLNQFPEARDRGALLKMSVEDPARYVAFQAHFADLQNAQAIQAQAQAAYANEWDAREASKLRELLPETADPVKGPVLAAKLRDYAKECGYSEQQIRWAAASDVKMLHDAMQFRDRAAADEAKAKAEAKAIEEARNKAKEAPPVQKAGVASKTDTKADKLKELKERAEKTGRVDDLAVYLAAKEAAGQ
jgi:hypothetical protein